MSLHTLQTTSDRPLYRQLVDWLRVDLATKAPGDRIDSEPQLAKRFGVSRFTVTRAIEIYLPSGGDWPVAVGADHAVFYLPVVGKGEMLGVIPVSNGHFAGIRIIPRMREDMDSVKIEISALALVKKALSDANCDGFRSWPSEDAGSYVAKKDESLLLSDLGRLGLPVLKMRVIGSSGTWKMYGDWQMCSLLQAFAAVRPRELPRT